jgi:hypothetical protein
MSARAAAITAVVLGLVLLCLITWRSRGWAVAPVAESVAESPVPAEPAAPVSAPGPDDPFQPAPDLAPPTPYAEPAPPTPWANVDLDAARREMPDNLYWELAAPTQDPRLLGDREREKARREQQHGRIQVGEASEAEIQDYYEHRQRMSSDYVRFVDWVLEHGGDGLAESDLELLYTARRLHMARLREIPKRLQEAFDQKKKLDAAREAWLADEAAFDAESSPDGDAPPPGGEAPEP